jgi:hypothetical protein
MPMSYNAWLYGYANPIRYIDMGGNRPVECPPGDKGCSLYGEDLAPTIENYSEKEAPRNIHWVTNTYSELVHQKLAPLFGRDNKLIVRKNAAQFKIQNHVITCDPDPEDPYKCLDGTTRNQNFCGQVTLSAILRLLDPEVTSEWVVEKLPGDRNGTGPQDIYDFVNNWYGEELYAEEIPVTSEEYLPASLQGWISARGMVMPYVNIVDGTSGHEWGGKIGVNLGNPISHWVLITGMSREWDFSVQGSPWNWVRIFNPFDNEAEYYWWEDFRPAWHQSTANYTTVMLTPKARKGQ